MQRKLKRRRDETLENNHRNLYWLNHFWFIPAFIITQISIGLDLGRADANEIGDTIGGILGPYFSFIGSVLLAYTIYLQIEYREADKKKVLTI